MDSSTNAWTVDTDLQTCVSVFSDWIQHEVVLTCKAQSTQDAGKLEHFSFDVACVQCGHPPFTSTGPICLHHIAHRVPRLVWIGPNTRVL